MSIVSKIRSWEVKKMRNKIIVAFARQLNILCSHFLFIAIFMAFASSGAFAEDRGRKEFWINKYGITKEYRYTARAYAVFERVLAAADRRTGIEPALYIVDYDKTPWAQALADGSIILSRKGLEFCYSRQAPEDGDSRLAFVIGHELAHQFNGDFWHYKFLRTAEDSDDNIRAFQDIKELAKSTDMLLAKELQADQYGIIFATMAGYNSDRIIAGDRNFFLEWAEKETPSGRLTENLRSLSSKRAKAVSMRLQEVSDRIVLFDMGVISYHLGRFDESLVLFKRFASFFPGREVYTNVGTIYLQMAYNKFRMARSPESFPYALSFGIEKRTRAESIDIASKGFTETGYREYNELLHIATDNLKKAIEYDPFYHEAKNNLGCAYIMENRYYDAVSVLEDALKSAPDSAKIQNNLGVAYIMLGQSVGSKGLLEKAEKMLLAARTRDRKAGSNFTSYQRMFTDLNSGPESDSPIDDPFDDINIEFKSSPKYKPEMSVSPGYGLSLLEVISDRGDSDLKVLKKVRENIFILAMGDRIRLVLYKEPSQLITNIKGGEQRSVYVSGTGRNGVVISVNTSPDYFEF
ncbi:MAG: hypothetical protein C4581_11185 [Nitrospiraceae bacterium]|nr:MAG: hypothetical protein C4581_11185 [Nitrospiraceae bacterium]